MYNEKILDTFYKDSTLALNIDDYQNLGLNIEKIITNPKLVNNIIRRGLEIYNASFNDNIVQTKLFKIFKNYQEYQNLWKNLELK